MKNKIAIIVCTLVAICSGGVEASTRGSMGGGTRNVPLAVHIPFEQKDFLSTDQGDDRFSHLNVYTGNRERMVVEGGLRGTPVEELPLFSEANFVEQDSSGTRHYRQNNPAGGGYLDLYIYKEGSR